MALKAGRVGVANDQVDPVSGKVLGDNAEYPDGVMSNSELTNTLNALPQNILYGAELSSVNLNDIKTYGRYRLNGSITSAPGFNFGILDVIVHNHNNITQIVYGNAADQAGVIVKRNYVNGSWSSWYKFTGTAL